MNFPVLQKSIEQKIGTVMELIRDFCGDQRALWQRVPTLALEADGRQGFSDAKKFAYRDGIWQPLWEKDTRFPVCVDLRTGELLQYIYGRQIDEMEPALPEDVLRLALALDSINATKIVEDLDCATRQPMPSHMNPVDRERNIEFYRPMVAEFYRRVAGR